jgi:hypothetical protein
LRQLHVWSLREHELALQCKDFDRLVYPLFVLLEHAELYQRAGNIDGARALITRVFEGRPERGTERGAKLTAAKFLIHDALQQRKFAEALEFIRRAQSLYPGHPDLIVLKVAALAASGDVSAAKMEAQSLAESPEHAAQAAELLRGAQPQR